jgi:hypothetical protein
MCRGQIATQCAVRSHLDSLHEISVASQASTTKAQMLCSTQQLDSEEQELAHIDTNQDGDIDEDEFKAYLAAHQADPTFFGAELVHVRGVVLHHGGVAKPYAGINGFYQRTGDLVNGRPIYIKVAEPTTAMWCSNNSGVCVYVYVCVCRTFLSSFSFKKSLIKVNMS